MTVLRRIAARGTFETARRLKDACGQVFRYLIAAGVCTRDAAADLRDALKPVNPKHMATVTDPKQMGDLLRVIDNYTGFPASRAALQLAPLLFQRQGNLRMMAWDELDLDEAVWTIPAAQMKRRVGDKINGDPNLVPLSLQAVAILRDLRPLTRGGDYVFSSVRGGDRPMSNMTLNCTVQRVGIDTQNDLSTHGYRATACTMLAERLGLAGNFIEAQLAHSVKDSLGRAYTASRPASRRCKALSLG